MSRRSEQTRQGRAGRASQSHESVGLRTCGPKGPDGERRHGTGPHRRNPIAIDQSQQFSVRTVEEHQIALKRGFSAENARDDLHAETVAVIGQQTGHGGEEIVAGRMHGYFSRQLAPILEQEGVFHPFDAFRRSDVQTLDLFGRNDFHKPCVSIPFSASINRSLSVRFRTAIRTY